MEVYKNICDPKVFPPCLAIYQIIHSVVLNQFLLYLSRNQNYKIACTYAGFIGLSHLWILYPLGVINFSLVTICFFLVIFCTSKLLSQLFELESENVLKSLLCVYSLICLRNYQDDDKLEHYVYVYVTLVFKIICVDEMYEREPRLEFTQAVVLFAYLLYPPWMPIVDFLNIPQNRYNPMRDVKWWTMVFVLSLQIQFFDVMGHYMDALNPFPLDEDVEYAYLSYIVYALRFRGKYYYRAFISELQLVAVGWQQGNWAKRGIVDLDVTELSITLKDSLKGANIQVYSYFKRKFYVDRGIEGPKYLPLICHSMAVLLMILTYDFKRGGLIFVTVGCMYWQEDTISFTKQLLGIGDHDNCTRRCCNNTFLRTSFFNRWILRSVFIVINQLRNSIMFFPLTKAIYVNTAAFYLMFFVFSEWSISMLLVIIFKRFPD